MTLRPILTTFKNPDLHWVGDGFLTQSMLPVAEHAHDTSPFLIAGYNPAMDFAATSRPKGVGMHPHRGFETVTIVYQGGVRHADTMGNSAEIGPGDVQWMTAGRGVQHEEFHSALINAAGGTLEMVQLWVNLPASEKLSAPRYQSLNRGDIATVSLPQGGSLRVIAGKYGDTLGAAQTLTALDVWDVSLKAGATHSFELPAEMSVSILLLKGKMTLADQSLEGPQTVIFDRRGGEIRLEAESDAHYLVLAGLPLNEPIAMNGPFVMNTEAELHQAWRDFRSSGF